MNTSCSILLAVAMSIPALRAQTVGVNAPSATTKADQNVPFTYGIFNPELASIRSYTEDGISVKLVRTSSSITATLTLRDVSRKVQLPPDLLQVDLLRKVENDKLAIVGRVASSMWEVAVVCLDSFTICDKFHAILPIISPNGQYLIFIKPYPLHSGISVEDHFMLYEFDEDARKNRDAGPPDSINVGVTLFPVGIGNRDSDNLGSVDPYRSASPDMVFWSPDSSRVLFAVTRGTRTDLVLATLFKHRHAAVAVTPVQSCSSNLEHPCHVLLRDASFSAHRVTATLVGGDSDKSHRAFQTITF